MFAAITNPHPTPVLTHSHPTPCTALQRTSSELGGLLEQLSGVSDLDEVQAAVVRDAFKAYKREVRLPKALAQRIAKLDSEAYQVGTVEARFSRTGTRLRIPVCALPKLLYQHMIVSIAILPTEATNLHECMI